MSPGGWGDLAAGVCGQPPGHARLLFQCVLSAKVFPYAVSFWTSHICCCSVQHTVVCIGWLYAV